MALSRDMLWLTLYKIWNFSRRPGSSLKASPSSRALRLYCKGNGDMKLQNMDL